MTRPHVLRNNPSKARLRLIQSNPTPPNDGRPKTRGECAGVERPCPWISCSQNLYLDVHPKTGSIKFTHPELEPGELRESCALDVSERGESSCEEVAVLLSVSRERVRQIEEGAIRKMARNGALAILKECR